MSEREEEELPKIPDDERERIERMILAAAFAPFSKLDRDDEDLSTTDIVDVLAEATIAAASVYDEAHDRLKETYDYFYLDTDLIVCSAYSGWLAGEDDTSRRAPYSRGGSWLSSFASFVLICASLKDAADRVSDSKTEEPPSFRGARLIKGLPKGFSDD